MMNKYNNYLTLALGSDGQSEKKIEQFNNNYSRFFPENKSANILDIGPGKGEMLSCLNKQGFSNIEAVDISESVADFIEKLGYKCSLTNDLVAFLAENSNKYDLITICDVVEHIPKDQTLGIMRAVYDALADRGTLIVQVPNMQSMVADIFRYDDFTHETGYTERSLAHMLTLCGFTLIQCYGFEFLDKSFKSQIHSMMRATLWFFLLKLRKLNGTMPHKIMHPVFFAVVKK
jgi:2-polyprenyl-3-methyl-5-hydroxy-6-metoxy-1,4-benzoquinol methylase